MRPTFHKKGYWAVILGASSGFGLATAHKLAQEGMNLCLLYRDRKKDLPRIRRDIEQMKQSGIQVIHFNEDATKKETQFATVNALKASLQNKGKVRLLLHSIAKGNLKPLSATVHQNSDFQEFTTNKSLQNAYQTIQNNIKNNHSSSHLKRQDFELTSTNMALSLLDWVQLLDTEQCFAADARVLGFTSEGSHKAWKNYAAVSAAKATLEALMRSIALEYAPKGIRCNLLQPGISDTPALRAIPNSDHLKLQTILRNPFQRLTKPEDVANAVYLLCTDEAKWINGAIIPVDGGEQNS